MEKLRKVWEFIPLPGELVGTTSVWLPKKTAIKRWIKQHPEDRYVILDDRDLGLPNQIKTEPLVGLVKMDAEWAITVHKSQGLTFEKMIADIGESFASGQVYVALSRCTSLDGLVLTSEINSRSVKTDSRVLAFAKNEATEAMLAQQLTDGKADFYYAAARKALSGKNEFLAVENFIKAVKYRNDLSTATFSRYATIWLG